MYAIIGTGKISKRKFEITAYRDVMIPVRDGVNISADDEPDDLTKVKMDHLCSQTPNTITIYHDARYPSHLLLPITRGNIIGTYASGGDIQSEDKGIHETRIDSRIQISGNRKSTRKSRLVND